MSDLVTEREIWELFWEENWADLGWKIDTEQHALVLQCPKCDDAIWAIGVRFGVTLIETQTEIRNLGLITKKLESHELICRPYDENTPAPTKSTNWIPLTDRERLHQYFMEQIQNAKDVDAMANIIEMRRKVEEQLNRECPAGYKVVIEYPAVGGVTISHQPMFNSEVMRMLAKS